MTTKKQPQRPRAIGRSLNFATGATNAMCQAMLAEHELTLPQWVALSALWQRDGLTVGEIATYSGTDVPAASRLVERMTLKRFVERRADPEDRRTVRIHLSTNGRALRPLRRFYESVNRALLKGLSLDDAELLYALLARVERNARRKLAEYAPSSDAPATTRRGKDRVRRSKR